MDQDDKQLIKDSLSGDSEAFRLLMTRHLPAVYSFTFRLTGDEGGASDITQETFVKVWKNLRKFKDKYSFKTWLFAIARNAAVDWLRKKRSVPFSSLMDKESETSFEETLVDPAALPDELFERADLKEILGEALTRLSLEKKTIIILHISQGLSFSEIAEVVGRPMNTVKSQYHRAIEAIRETLAAEKRPII